MVLSQATSSAPSLLQESEAGHTPGIANALSFRNETSCLRSSRVHAGITTHFPVNSDSEVSEEKQVDTNMATAVRIQPGSQPLKIEKFWQRF